MEQLCLDGNTSIYIMVYFNILKSPLRLTAQGKKKKKKEFSENITAH